MSYRSTRVPSTLFPFSVLEVLRSVILFGFNAIHEGRARCSFDDWDPRASPVSIPQRPPMFKCAVASTGAAGAGNEDGGLGYGERWPSGDDDSELRRHQGTIALGAMVGVVVLVRRWQVSWACESASRDKTVCGHRGRCTICR